MAGRLSEDSNAKILLLEAGMDSEDMDNMYMAGAYAYDALLGLHSPIAGFDPDLVQLDSES